MIQVVGVHGVGNYRPGYSLDQAGDVLARIWAKALGSAIPAAKGTDPPIAVAYYADLLQRPGRQGNGHLDSLDAFELALAEEWLQEIAIPDAVSAGKATAPLRQALAWVASSRKMGRPIVEWFVATFFREVASYLRDEDGAIRTAARARVADAIATHQPQVVIAHSLGSIVAYETLWADPGLTVDLLVTLGSPLALPHAVFHRLQPPPEAGRGCKPPGVRRWVNLADLGDLVALPPGGLERQFDGVERNRPKAQSIHVFDFHKAANYLATPELHALLDACL
ncbi:hypothetical protein [Streptomyces sp. NPDC057199]|uniref:hypothetical protein n=1 Tax=Streptomyces sp. NPDC057199 TaxID=3346047 RepID=UPI003638C6A5